MQANDTDPDLAPNDLGPLAWVLDELRKSLDSASAALRRFVRDAGQARGTDMASLDDGQLRIARQQLHQAVGALEMVGLGAPARLLRAMESAAQKFVERPELCSEAAAAKVERAGFALTDFLKGVLLGKPVTAVALFPQYRDVQELAGSDRIHPADLWILDWRWVEPQSPPGVQALAYEPAVRSRLDQAVLRVVKSGDAAAAADLAQLCLSLAANQSTRQPRIFWGIGAGFFEALSLGLLPLDLYVKRAASRVLMQYASLAKEDPAVSERLAQDLLFFCAQAVPSPRTAATALEAVRRAYELDRFAAVDYQTSPFGRFDPLLMAQARKRIGQAKESWSALAGGDVTKLKPAAEHFQSVADSLTKLHPPSTPLAQALGAAANTVWQSAQPPAPELAVEVATAVLYLEAVFEDLDPTDTELARRTTRLAERLEAVRRGGQPEPLEPWMEELYRRVSDRQTMGSVVGELRATLNELEKHLDNYFRDPQDKAPLQAVPGHLTQIRGVLAVLGLEQAARAVLRMCQSVEQITAAESDDDAARITFDKLGNNLGALGFLIDMLNYQPTLAKKLFVYDEQAGELRPLMGRGAPVAQVASPSVPDKGLALPLAPDSPALQPAAAAVSAAPAPAAAEEDGELREIFLEEAREVVRNGLQAIDAMLADPHDASELTTLRRAFHTLKGSSRMVGLTEFGEAGWSMEQLVNTWLADQKPPTPELLGVAGDALRGFGRWVEDIASRQDSGWEARMFRSPADALRTEHRVVPFALPGMDAPVVAPAAVDDPWAVEDIELIEAPALPAAQPAADFSFGPGEVAASPASSPTEPAGLDFAALEGVSPAGPAAEPVSALAEEVAFDFDLAALLPPTAQGEGADLAGFEAPAQPEPEPQAPVQSESVQDLPQPALEPVEMNGPEEAAEMERVDEQVKVIGSLRIGIPLYNVYLNEADEWSRRLVTEVAEWALELNQPVPDAAVGWAHALAGSSATVGFHALSDIARALESALQHTQSLAHGTPLHGKTFIEAAEEIRRLLHQFAAGFLKEPDPTIAVALGVLKDIAVPLREDVPAEAPGVEFAGPDDAPDAAVPALIETPPAAVPAPLAPWASGPAQEVVPAPAAPRLEAAEDDIDVADAIDADLFPIFEEEALELMPQLGGALRQWAARTDHRGARDAVLRALHTLKGSARLAGALRLGEMAHRMESEIEFLGADHVHAADVEALLHYFDQLQANFDTLRATGGLSTAPVAEEAASAPAAPAIAAAADGSADRPADPQAAATVPPRQALALPSAMILAPQRAAANQAVRVRSQLLDRLVNQAGEVMITRSRLESELRQLRGSLSDLTGNLDRLRSQLRDIELQAESQMQSRLAQAKDSAAGFDPLEFDRFTRVQELTRMMAESVNDVATVQRNLQRTVESTEDDLIAQARQTRELQRDLLRTRMVEFEGIADRLYRVVRLASKETGKQVKLDITGGSIEMDRGVLDRMTPAFEHLLRNCVAHGIEEPAIRSAAGKDPAGTIVIGLHHEGNDVSVEFHDDGAGLNLAAIRDKAVHQGLIAPGQALSDADAANLIFMPGFSTAAQVTELAGRGIGMDVVRAEVNALGGRIETSTQAGQGTRFKLVLPLTTAVTQVVMFRTGSLVMGVPAHLVEVVRRATVREAQQAYNSGFYELGGEQLPFYWSGALLQASPRSTEPQGKTQPVIVFRSAAQRVAVHMDEVLGNQEVVVKNLGPQLSRLPGLAGMTVLASGAVVLIYNPVALATVYGDQARQLSADQAQPDVLGRTAAGDAVPAAPVIAQPPQVPLVLVVDDSITVRRVTQRLLQREGYRVAMAADGLQALERLAEEKPTVVLSDIEMPRMDGFDLARNIRADVRLADLPIIMITSRIAAKHREHARELGVDHYLGKPYSEEELLSLVRSYCRGAVAA